MKLGSNQVDYLKLISFVTWLLALAWIIVTQFLKMKIEVPPIATIVVDGTFSILLLVGGIATSTSDASQVLVAIPPTRSKMEKVPSTTIVAIGGTSIFIFKNCVTIIHANANNHITNEISFR